MRKRAIIGLMLAGLSFASFEENADWKFWQVMSSVPRQEEIVRALQSGADAQSLGDKYAIDFSMSKDASYAVEGIKAFRAAGAVLYGAGRADESPMRMEKR
jgi:hypothetical protein